MIECQECGQAFQNSGALRMHNLWKHKKSQALSQEEVSLNDLNPINPNNRVKEHNYACPECEAYFDELNKDWFGNYSCPICDVKLEVVE